MTEPATEYEYCVMAEHHPDEPHRGPWPQLDCEEWVQEWETMPSGTINPSRMGMFYVARRSVTPWEPDTDG